MARRVVLTMLALVSALLITAVVPLGLITAGREQDSFQTATVMSAQALATVADKQFSDHDHDTDLSLATSLARANQRGDEVWVYEVYERATQLVARIGGARSEKLPVPLGTVAYVQRTGRFAMSVRGGELRVTVTVTDMGGRPAGRDTGARPSDRPVR